MIVKDSKDEVLQYLVDQSNFKGDCEKVFFVENEVDISETLVRANLLKIPVTVSGNHTSLTGSSIPQGGWVIATDKLNRIIEINESERYAFVEPGITLRDLQIKLKEKGLFFPPDPTEDSCFIGGMIGTNASGAKSFKFGSTRNFIEELEIILPTGELLRLARDKHIIGPKFYIKVNSTKTIEFTIPDSYKLPPVKNTAGYHLTENMSVIDLFIGAEGTLGVISKVKIRLEKLPQNILSFVIFFKKIRECFSFLAALEGKKFKKGDNSKIEPWILEFFDRRSLNLLKPTYNQLPDDSDCGLWIEQPIDSDDIMPAMLNWQELMEEMNIPLDEIWFGGDDSDREKFVKIRHALPLKINELMLKRGMRKLGTDVAVPNKMFSDFYEQIYLNVEASNIDYVIFGHFGDCHIHLNFLPFNEWESEKSKKLYEYISELAIKAGGTFSAEHGVGKTKKKYTLALLGKENLKFMSEVKALFDPNRILGAGNLI